MSRPSPTDRLLRRRRGVRSVGEIRVVDRRAASTVVAPRLDPPQDRATYQCSCGFQFSADVSTTVACPHCGVAQAW